MEVSDILKIVLLATTSTVVMMNLFLLIKSRCCNSVCINGLKNEKNNNPSNIENNNTNINV